MKSYTLEIDINLPRDRVLELFDDPDNLPKWQPGFQSFEHISGEPGKPGSKAKLLYLNGKQTVELIETLTVHDLPERLDGTYEWPTGSNTLENRFHEVDANTTRWVSTCTYQFSSFGLKLMGFLMPWLFRRQNFLFMRHFKAFCEEGKDVRDKKK